MYNVEAFALLIYCNLPRYVPQLYCIYTYMYIYIYIYIIYIHTYIYICVVIVTSLLEGSIFKH